jgi:hypothetical protein
MGGNDAVRSDRDGKDGIWMVGRPAETAVTVV